MVETLYIVIVLQIFILSLTKIKKTMKTILRFVLILAVTGAICAGCEKKEKLYFTTLGTISDKVSVIDIAVVDESTFLLLSRDKDDKSVIYVCTQKNQNTWSFSKRMTIIDQYNDIDFVDGVTWMCGDKMFLTKSFDTLKTRQRHTKFNYWNDWPSEKKNLKELYVLNGRPQYMIGTDDLLTGSFYTYKYADTVYSSSKKHFGLNDMVVCGSDAYVAGYGSIVHVSDNGATETLENIGGENFTHICTAGSYLFTCTYSGDIYRSEIGSNDWRKVCTTGKHLLFIEANKYGDVIATGETKEVLVSQDFGANWEEEKYSDGNKISCVVTIDDTFYLGTSKGVVLKINHGTFAINE